VELLLSFEADPLLIAEDGSTAYTIATSTGRSVVAALLAEASLAAAIITGESSVRSCWLL